MGMGTSTGGGVQSEINITPLVDVVLVLLIIFMVAQPMMQHGYDSAIPRPDPNQQVTPPDPNVPTFILKLTANATSGELNSPILNNETVARPELLDKVRTEMTRVQSRDRVVFIDCADNVNYNDLMRVVDDLKLADVKTVGFATEPITAN
jgi:biopolymer transport protein ExbD